ncbi:MAG: hypothetical protein MJZ00_08545 [Paludibacteraceae bacterium]|nr:hypothetical protein [Paludibacteraceae bacterium]
MRQTRLLLAVATGMLLSAGSVFAQRSHSSSGGRVSGGGSSAPSSAPSYQPSYNWTYQPAFSASTYSGGYNQWGNPNNTGSSSYSSGWTGYYVAGPEKKSDNRPYFGMIVRKRKAVNNSERIIQGAEEFYYRNGIFYHHTDGIYKIDHPSPGVRVKTLPDYNFCSVDNEKYYYYYGIFYRFVEDTKEFEVVAPPVGAVVRDIPNDGSHKKKNKLFCEEKNDDFFNVGGVSYKKTEYRNQLCYVVTKADKNY